MNQDQDYIALIQIQRSMQNEISSLSLGSTRLTDYIHSMKRSSLAINGTLKAMDLLAGMDEKRKDRRSAAYVKAWMNELIRMKSHPMLGMLVQNVDLALPVQPEFINRTSPAKTRIQRIISRQTWLMIIAAALILGGLLAFLVLVLHWDFYWTLALCLCLYALIAAYTFFWLARRKEVRLFKELTRQMSAPSQSFVRSIQIENLGLLPDLASIRAMIQVWQAKRDQIRTQAKAERKIKREKQAQARAEKRRLARLEKQTVHHTTVRTHSSSRNSSRQSARKATPSTPQFAPGSILAVTYDFDNAPITDAASLFESHPEPNPMPLASRPSASARRSVWVDLDESDEVDGIDQMSPISQADLANTGSWPESSPETSLAPPQKSSPAPRKFHIPTL